MIRWNIKAIFLMSCHGERRDVILQENSVNIITGASGTGKSALIKIIDYCLGSKDCEIPVHIRRHCVAVGVKWAAGVEEIVVGRLIPAVGKKTSTKMYVSTGRNLELPDSLNNFEGITTVDAARSSLERAFGISSSSLKDEHSRGRATVRNVTPYIFVTKEVIYSETVLLHGLDNKDKADTIVDSMPYFLGAATDTAARDERRLRQLRKGLEVEEARERARTTAESLRKERALALLTEASRIGLIRKPSTDVAEADLLRQLRELKETSRPADVYTGDDRLSSLYEQRSQLVLELNEINLEQRAARNAVNDARGFKTAVGRQHQKLRLAEHLKLDAISRTCPVCDSETTKGTAAAEALLASIEKIRAESSAVERVQPNILAYLEELNSKSRQFSARIRALDIEIQGLLREIDESQNLTDRLQVRSHHLGRVSYFLDTSMDTPAREARDLNLIKQEIEELEAGLDREAKEIRLRRAEAQVSRFASEIFAKLPTKIPCVGAELVFSSRKPEVTVIEDGPSGALLRMADLGSDENYLAIHISLSFGLQRHFNKVNSPVPGLLVLDQISRPYFPDREEGDETELRGEDEDVLAMKKHVDFLFEEVKRNKGLQVLLIEHAYFADDPRYVGATKERWTRASKNALIPLEWPSRSDA